MDMSHGHSKHNGGSRGAHQLGGHFDLSAAVRRVVIAAGFEPGLNAEAKQQLDGLSGPASHEPQVKDLRDQPWSSIDNNESRDLDQIEIAEQLPDGNIRLMVGIADVDVLVAKGTPL